MTCATDGLCDRAILMVAFASGGRRSGIAGRRTEQLSGEAPIEVVVGPSPSCHSFGRTKTSTGDRDDIDSGSVFREIGRWRTGCDWGV